MENIIEKNNCLRYELCMMDIKKIESIRNHNKIKFNYKFYLDIIRNFEKDLNIVSNIENLFENLISNSKKTSSNLEKYNTENVMNKNDITYLKEKFIIIYRKLKKQGFDSEDLKKLIIFLNKAILYDKKICVSNS